MKTKILLSLIILVLLGGMIGYKIYNKPHKDIQSAESTLKIAANELMAEFNTDEKAANAKHLDKIITVTGTIGEVKNEGDQTIILLATDDPLASVICNLDPFSSHKDHQYQVGEAVSFKGICSGFLADVVIDRCVLIN